MQLRLIFLSFILHKALFAAFDLDTLAQDFILETKRIIIPEYPSAFNPSMVPWGDDILMSFRVILDPKLKYHSSIGLILLDKEFNPIAPPQILQTTPSDAEVPSRDEDARLVYIQDKLYIVYSSNPEKKLSAGGFRMTVAELFCDQEIFFIKDPIRITEYEDKNEKIREKNWVPFEYKNVLLLSYSISPHVVVMQIPGTENGTTFSRSECLVPWDWGIIRGGTPAIFLSEGIYFALFHSWTTLASFQSRGTDMKHYFFGAYTFAPDPPFEILSISKEPIIHHDFYSGASYFPYWEKNLCAFPAGLIVDGETLFVSYGRQDHEIWIAKLDKQKLLESLIPVDGP